MLLMNKTLLKLARGLWLWILAIAGVGFSGADHHDGGLSYVGRYHGAG